MTSSNDPASNPSRPNVVFIVGDNVGWGDIGCYGGTAPNNVRTQARKWLKTLERERD